MSIKRQSWGLIGSLFVSSCCLGAGPIIAAAAASVGLGALKSVFNIFVLAPLMVLSVAWVSWNMARQAKGLTVPVRQYGPFWLAVGGGTTATIGVVLPHVIHGTGIAGTTLIVVGMIVLLMGSVAGIADQRRRTRHVAAHGKEGG